MGVRRSLGVVCELKEERKRWGVRGLSRLQLGSRCRLIRLRAEFCAVGALIAPTFFC